MIPPNRMIPPPPPVEQMPLLIDAAKTAGITYRQADYWARRGYIHPTPYRREPHTNQPANHASRRHLRRLHPIEATVLHTMARLVNAGLCPATAAIVARSHVEDPTQPLTLAPGIRLLINNRHPQGQP